MTKTMARYLVCQHPGCEKDVPKGHYKFCKAHTQTKPVARQEPAPKIKAVPHAEWEKDYLRRCGYGQGEGRSLSAEEKAAILYTITPIDQILDRHNEPMAMPHHKF